MRDYEIVYIFRSSLTPEEIEAKLERYHAVITESGQGEITAVVQWGKRQLAYPIQKQSNGHYVVTQFTSPPQPLTELERVLKLEDDLLRYLVVISEGEMPLPEVSHHTRDAGRGGEAAAEPDKTASGEGDAPAAEDAAATDGPTDAAVEDGAAADGEEGADAAGGDGDAAAAADPAAEDDAAASEEGSDDASAEDADAELDDGAEDEDDAGAEGADEEDAGEEGADEREE